MPNLRNSDMRGPAAVPQGIPGCFLCPAPDQLKRRIRERGDVGKCRAVARIPGERAGYDRASAHAELGHGVDGGPGGSGF